MDRKEAIEVIKKNYPHVGISGSEFESALRELVPDLKESEDERIKKAISAAICGTTAISILEANGTNLSDALSYLEKQKDSKVVKIDHDREQKPAEWSMEDAIAMKDIQMIISVSGRSEKNKRDLCAWVAEHCNAYPLPEKLRPHWKPSEEQMKALNEIINTLAVSKHPHENYYLFNILNGLRKNLKSL